MKARVQTGTVLICCMEETAARSELEKFFTARRVSVRFAGKEHLGQRLDTLLGLPGGAHAPEEGDLAAAAPALIFSSFSDRALDRILDELNESGLAHGILRAVTTPHNRSWTLAVLLRELSAEREAMQTSQDKEAHAGD